MPRQRRELSALPGRVSPRTVMQVRQGLTPSGLSCSPLGRGVKKECGSPTRSRVPSCFPGTAYVGSRREVVAAVQAAGPTTPGNVCSAYLNGQPQSLLALPPPPAEITDQRSDSGPGSTAVALLSRSPAPDLQLRVAESVMTRWMRRYCTANPEWHLEQGDAGCGRKSASRCDQRRSSSWQILLRS